MNEQEQKTPEEHPLNQEAMEILRELEGLEEEDPNPPLDLYPPVLALFDRILGIEGVGVVSEKLMGLLTMEMEGKHDQLMELLMIYPHGELPLDASQVMFLKEKSLKEQEQIKQGLRIDLLNWLADVKLLSETDSEIQVYIDEFLARRTASSSTLTPEQDANAVIYVMPNQEAVPVVLTPAHEELLTDWGDTVDQDTREMLTQKNTLTDGEQELLEALKADPNALTSEQEELLTDWGDVVSENKLDILTQKDNLDTFEQELFEALKEGLKNTIVDTLQTKTDSEIIKAPNISSTQEKIAHHSENQVKTSDSASYYYNQGVTKYYLSQYEAAITDFDNAIQLKPNYTSVYNRRGLAKYHLGQYEAAITDFDNAIQLKPDSAIYYHNRGRAKHGLSQYEAAIADFDNAIQLKSDHAVIYYNRAEAKRHLEQYKVAILDYDSAIRLKPNYVLAYYNRGNAKAKLGQTSEAEQDWQTALKLATKTNNVKLKNEIESVLQRSADSQIKLDFEPDKEKVTDHSEDQAETSEPQAKEKSVHYSEDQIKDIVADYFESLPTASPGYNVMREYVIQMGSDQRRADIVFLRNGKLGAIAECKEKGRVGKGIQQLHSYLCATDTYLGIFANDGDLNKWTFWENHRHNNFVEIDRKTFENYIYNHDQTIKDRENKIKAEVQREIDAEIRGRVRKNTDTDTVRQNETDRIKREVIEDIDKKAIVNSVKSDIAQQAENGLLKERDKANRKLGREQGFLLTIFSLIGIGILIALLITSG